MNEQSFFFADFICLQTFEDEKKFFAHHHFGILPKTEKEKADFVEAVQIRKQVLKASQEETPNGE